MKCKFCGTKLVDGVCPNCKTEINDDTVAVVTSASDDFDADVKMSLLRSCGIPCFKSYGGFSSVAKVYCGSSSLGINICVLKSNLKKADEILNAPFDENELNGGEGN